MDACVVLRLLFSSSPLGLRLWGQEEEEEAEFQWNWAVNTEVHTIIVLWRRRDSALQAPGHLSRKTRVHHLQGLSGKGCFGEDARPSEAKC